MVENWFNPLLDAFRWHALFLPLQLDVAETQTNSDEENIGKRNRTRAGSGKIVYEGERGRSG